MVKETVPMGQREWSDILANQWHQENSLSSEISQFAMTLGRRYDQDEREVDGAVRWNSMVPKMRMRS